MRWRAERASNGWKSDERIETESDSIRLSVLRSNSFETGETFTICRGKPAGDCTARFGVKSLALFGSVASVVFVNELLRERISE
jgi:hypothetical protein